MEETNTMLKIELLNTETKKKETFTQDFISARLVRKSLELQVEMKKGKKSDLEYLDNAIEFVVSVFDNPAVTVDAILDGLNGNELWKTLIEILNKVANGDNDEANSEGK